MALYNYFTKLGTIDYNNESVVNIISSARIRESIKSKIDLFYPYTISEGERADNIASFYYGDPRYSWLVYLCNEIIDPYFEWPLSENEMRKFLITKYGSIEESIKTIMFFKVNWQDDDSLIDSSAYNSLPAALKKYWKPYNDTANVYERSRIDRVLETNKVVQLAVTPSTAGLIVNERVVQSSSNTTATIKAIVDNNIVVNNVIGTFTTGSVKSANTQLTKSITSINTIVNSIPTEEYVYWKPVTAYDYETELNDSRKTIQLIDSKYVPVIEDEMIELLS